MVAEAGVAASPHTQTPLDAADNTLAHNTTLNLCFRLQCGHYTGLNNPLRDPHFSTGAFVECSFLNCAQKNLEMNKYIALVDHLVEITIRIHDERELPLILLADGQLDR